MTSSTTPLQTALQHFGQHSTPHYILRRPSHLLFRISGGRVGSLAINPRHRGVLLDDVFEIGAAEGETADPDTVHTTTSGAELIARFGETFESQLRAETVAHLASRRRTATIRASHIARVLLLAVLMILAVIGLDYLANFALVARIISGLAGWQVHIASVFVTGMMLGIGHAIAVRVPPGRRSHLRRTLIVTGIIAMAIFIISGAWLRTHSIQSSTATAGINGGTDNTLESLAGPLIGTTTMVALMLSTVILAALLALHHTERQEELNPTGPQFQTAQQAEIAVARACLSTIEAGYTLTGELLAAHQAGFRSTAPGDLADRTQLPAVRRTNHAITQLQTFTTTPN